MFGMSSASGPHSEDWSETAWNDPLDAMSDPRSRWLDARRDVHMPDGDVAMYGDGGYSRRCGASFAAQLRAFGDAEGYWEDSAPDGCAVASRMPLRYGFEKTTVHGRVDGITGSAEVAQAGPMEYVCGG